MSVARPDTWMPLYVSDYLVDTMHLTTEQHGAYLLLLMACWKRGGALPNDEAQLASIARLPLPKWRVMRSLIVSFFLIADDKLTHKRVAIELSKARDITDARVMGGRRGGVAARGKSGRPKKIAQPFPENSPAISQPLKNGGFEIAEEWQKNRPSQSQIEEREAIASPKKGAADDRKRGCRLPDDWRPDEDDIGFASDLGLHVRDLSEQFRDYWHAKPGAGGVKLDWSATWRNWCRKAVADGKARKPVNGHSPANALFAGAHAAVEERAERREAERSAYRGAGFDPAEPLLDGR